MSAGLSTPPPGEDGGSAVVAESERVGSPASADELLLIEGAPEIEAVALPSARLRPLPAGIDGAGGTLGAPEAPAAASGSRVAAEGELALPIPVVEPPTGVVPKPLDGGAADGAPPADPEASDAGGVAPNGRAPPRPVAGGSDGGAAGVGDEDEKPPPEVRRAGAEGGAVAGASGRSEAPLPLVLPTAGPERGVVPERLAGGTTGEPAGVAEPLGAVASVGFERDAPNGDAAGGCRTAGVSFPEEVAALGGVAGGRAPNPPPPAVDDEAGGESEEAKEVSALPDPEPFGFVSAPPDPRIPRALGGVIGGRGDDPEELAADPESTAPELPESDASLTGSDGGGVSAATSPAFPPGPFPEPLCSTAKAPMPIRMAIAMRRAMSALVKFGFLLAMSSVSALPAHRTSSRSGHERKGGIAEVGRTRKSGSARRRCPIEVAAPPYAPCARGARVPHQEKKKDAP